jgi:radical SAM protein with 4Fe4S-binding SPASM domain
MSAAIKNYSATRMSGSEPSLSELLPLSTPLSLLIDPSNGCNLACVFCPTGDEQLLKSAGRQARVMHVAVFQSIVEGLSQFPDRIKVLHLYKDGEPLVNKHLAEFVRIAKVSNRFERVETTTNGVLLSPARSQELIEAGIDGIRVSIYGLDDQSYRGTTQCSVSFDSVVANVSALFQIKSKLNPPMHVHCKITDVRLSNEDRDHFVRTFGPISDSIHIDALMGWTSPEGKDLMLGIVQTTGMSGSPLKSDRKVCSEPFMRLAVNSNGSVSVCCVDWSHETAVGHAPSETLFTIWNGERMNAFRRKHLSGRRSELTACRNCQYVLGLSERADIDGAAARLTPLY